ncbi:helix-turn-helix domain-containing protein [Spirillospora sp. CA-253888]
MTDDLRERLRDAIDNTPIFGTGDILDAIEPVVELEIERRAASCGCPEADAEHARVLARAEQDSAALARVQALADRWRTDRQRMRAARELTTALTGQPPSLGARIRARRVDAGYGLNELSELARIGRETLNNIEADRQQPLPETLEAIAAALGTTPTELTPPAREAT